MLNITKFTVLDSSGSPQTGFVFGQNYWLGSIQECEAVRNPIPITLDSRFTRNMKPNLMGATAPFDMEYRVVYAQHESPWQIEVKVLSEVSNSSLFIHAQHKSPNLPYYLPIL